MFAPWRSHNPLLKRDVSDYWKIIHSAFPFPHLSRIPVNKGIKSRLGWTKYSDLYEIVHPSLGFISSFSDLLAKYDKYHVIYRPSPHYAPVSKH